MSFYLFRLTETRITAGSVFLEMVPMSDGFVRKTQSGGSFGWGGTSVK